MKPQSHQNIFSLARNQFAFWWIPAMIFTSILFFNACTNEDYEQSTFDKRVVLNLKLNTIPLSTRSNESSETVKDKEGTELENQINNEDIWIAAFDSNSHQRIEILYHVGEFDKTASIVIKNFENYSDNIQIIALANWDRFGITKEKLESVTNLSELSELTFSFDPNNLTSNISDNSIDYYPLPMYGYTTYSFNSDSNEINIDMNRALAKIEIVDNLQGEVKIESATLVKFSTESYLLPKSTNISEGTFDSATFVSESLSTIGNNLIFNKTTDDSNVTTFYAYVPEIDLGASDSDFRKIELMLTNDKESEIRLINYSDGIPSTEPNEKWQSLNRNHIYRFNVKELTSIEPEIQIQPTIRICWYETRNGKYSGNFLNFYHSNDISWPLLGNDKEIFEGRNGYYSFDYILPENEDGNNVYFDNRYYTLIKSNGSYDDFMTKKLSLDLVSIYNDANVTFCWLNNCPQYDLTTFPTNHPLRIYWCGPQSEWSMTLATTIGNKRSTEEINEALFNESRKYWFLDINFKDNTTLLRIDIAHTNNIDIITFCEPQDVTTETINGEEYYVFYAN